MSRPSRLGVVLAAALAVGSLMLGGVAVATASTAAVPAEPTGAVTVVSGNSQTAPSGSPFAAPLVASVATLATQPTAVPGRLVTFTVTSGSATFATGPTATALTNPEGRATAPTLTAGPAPGRVVVTATAPDATPTSFALTVEPTSRLTAVSGSSQTARTGSSFAAPLVVSVATVATPSAAVPDQPVTFTVTSGSATFANGTATSSATATTNAAGLATAPTLTAGPVTGPVVVTATAPRAAPLAFALTVGPVVSETPTASVAVASGNAQRATVEQAFAAPLAVTVTAGTPAVGVPGRQVTFTVTGGAAAFPEGASSSSVTTDAQGRASAPVLTAGTDPGDVTVQAATAGAAQPVVFTLTVDPVNENPGGPGQPGGPTPPAVDPNAEVDQTADDGSEPVANGDQVEEVPLGSVDTGGWS